MDFKQFRYFIAVADEQHMGRAAEKIRVAQPALSQQIKLLEQRMGTLLFNREKRGLRLTEAGRDFLVHARESVRQAELALELGRRAGLGQVGRLTIGFLDSVLYSLPWQRMLTDFRQTHPDVEIELFNTKADEQIARLERGLLDIATLRAALPKLSCDLAAERIHSERLFVALPKTHHLASNESISLASLAGEDITTTVENAGVGLAGLITSLFAEAGIPVKISGRSGLASPLVPLVAAGFGIAIIPQALCAIRMDEVVFRPLECETTTEVYIVRRVNEARPVPKAFLDSCRKTLENLSNSVREAGPKQAAE